jgi:hypothetical protein
MARRGNQELRLRLESDVLKLLKELVPPGERGRGGGVAHFVRGLIYRELGLGEPPRFAAEVSPRKRKKPE